jgi:hypothetical protein
LFSFSIKVFKICALILGRSVYLPNISWTAIVNWTVCYVAVNHNLRPLLLY